MNASLDTLLRRIHDTRVPETQDLASALAVSDPDQTRTLFEYANAVRHAHMGDGILLRGIVEFSSFCRNDCAYCGLNKNNITLTRYRLSSGELLESVAKIAKDGIKTVVLQSGEEDDLDVGWLAEMIAEITRRFGIAITVSVGERPTADYRRWRDAGADRYLLKIETTDPALYKRLHPSMEQENRFRCLTDLREIGFQVGSGIIVGLPRQTPEILAGDIQFFATMDFDMIGIGPFIPHRQTELGAADAGRADMTLKVLALTRIVTKNAHLPATTALGSLNGKDYRIEGLKAGANVLMPNYTPQPYRKLYEIYPDKRCVDEPQGACAFCMESMAASIGRTIDLSRGDTRKKR